MPVMGRITADNNIKCVIGKWQTSAYPWRVVIFFSCRASAACATTSSIWADISHTPPPCSRFAQRQSWHALLRSPYQVHLHQDNQPDAPPGAVNLVRMHVRYWSDFAGLRAKLLFYVVMVGLCCHCAVLLLFEYKRTAPNVGLPCGRPDIPYLSGLPGLNSTSSGL